MFPDDEEDGNLFPIPESRSPNMTEPAPLADVSDADLMTVEELGALPATIEAPPPYKHDENIALKLDAKYLDKLGQDILSMIDADEESRKPWVERFKRGLEVVGLKDFVWDKSGTIGGNLAPFDGASTAVMPILSEAVVQSQARFMEEIFPAAGPVKTQVMGKEVPEKRESADRVASHMNYQLTIEDTTYFMETSKLAFYLPIYGTGYRKSYHDYVTDKNLLRFVPGEDIILPYSARNLQSSPRVTHRFPVEQNEYKKGVKAGAYCDVDLQDEGPPEPDQIQQERDKSDSKTPTESDFDVNWTFYETDLALDVPGYEDADDLGQKTGIALPYTVTLEKISGKVLAIRRNWDEKDRLKERLTRYAEYWYMPGIGAYGYGLIHLIGGLAEAGTDALRALLDSATWANLQGGFKAKDAATKGGELHLEPGVWKDVDMTAEELGKAFHTPPFHEPSPALFQLLGLLIEQGRRFAGTTELMVGEGDAKAPVGTTVALIEQGSKVYAGTHKRAHFAAGIEFRMLFRLNSIYIPEEGYPYNVPGDDLVVYRKDYDTSIVSVVPVSDPNIFSQTQRIALAQAEYQLARDNPQDFNKTAILKRLLKAFRDPDPEEVLIDPMNVPLMDPVSENVAIMTMHPVKAKDGEDHAAHLAVHMAFVQHPQYGGLPEAQKLIGPAMTAHMAEHLALLYAQIQRGLGVPVPPINLMQQPGMPIVPETPPQVAAIVAQMAAKQIGAFMQQAGFTTTPPQQGGGQEQETPLDQAEKKAGVLQKIGSATQAFAKAGQTLASGDAQMGALDSDLDAATNRGQPQPAL